MFDALLVPKGNEALVQKYLQQVKRNPCEPQPGMVLRHGLTNCDQVSTTLTTIDGKSVRVSDMSAWWTFVSLDWFHRKADDIVETEFVFQPLDGNAWGGVRVNTDTPAYEKVQTTCKNCEG